MSLKKTNQYYWAVGLVNGSKVMLMAGSMHTINGDLNFFNSEGEMLTAFAQGVWEYATPADVLMGGQPLIEHWLAKHGEPYTEICKQQPETITS